jgi:hypothetical protein
MFENLNMLQRRVFWIPDDFSFPTRTKCQGGACEPLATAKVLLMKGRSYCDKLCARFRPA